MPLANEREELIANAKPSTFDQAMVEMRAAVGSDNVLLESEALARYSCDTIPWQRTCSAVVYPSSRDEVCAIVKIAAQHQLPLWTFSKGKNWGYGASMAAQNGAVILPLERMNRILEVNKDLAYAVIEPGVTYKQLADHLKSRAIKLWADCTDSTPEGSVLGNALDHGLGHTPYGAGPHALWGPFREPLRSGGGACQRGSHSNRRRAARFAYVAHLQMGHGALPRGVV